MKRHLIGPSEVRIATVPHLREMLEKIVGEGTAPMACKFCCDKHVGSDLLEGLGCVVGYVGASMSEAIRDGCVPMVW